MYLGYNYPYSWFEKWSSLEGGKGTDEEYERIKKIIGQKFIDQAAHFYPKIKVNCRLRPTSYNYLKKVIKIYVEFPTRTQLITFMLPRR